jgi:hypothetical protein
LKEKNEASKKNSGFEKMEKRKKKIENLKKNGEFKKKWRM